MSMDITIVRANGDDASGVVVLVDGEQFGDIYLQHDCPEDHTEARLGLGIFIEQLLELVGFDNLEVIDKGYVDDPYTVLFEEDLPEE